MGDITPAHVRHRPGGVLSAPTQKNNTHEGLHVEMGRHRLGGTMQVTT
jgi:hypothetical protein